MTHIIIKHKVNDYETWKEVFDNFADVRKSSGEKSYRILQPTDNPNDLTLLFEWDTPKNAETFLESRELKDAMQRGGVTGEPTIQFMNEAAKGTL
jgi:heme-degrading monooxygenase HmoA